ncbi:MAG: tetratricopeptide repeat protein [Desulfitobacteriaceae bacterium]
MNEQLVNTWRTFMDEGTRCLSKEDYQKAEGYFSQSAVTARQLGVPEILAFTLRLLATTRVKLGELEVAESGLREALIICEDIQNAKGMAEAWAGLASVALGRSLFQEAVQFYEQSIAIYPLSSPPLRLGMLYSDLGQAYTYLEDWEKALKAYLSAKELCHTHGYPKGEGELEVLIGEVFYRQGLKREAELWLKKACQVFVVLGDVPILANALQYLAFIYYDQNKMELAREAQQRAVVLWVGQDMKLEASESCYFLSKIEQNIGQAGESELYLELSIQLYGQEDLGLALRYQSLAGLALTGLDLPKAEVYFTKSLELFERLHEEIKAGEVCETLAFLVDLDGRKKEALVYHKKAVAKLSGNAPMAVEAIQGIAAFYEKHLNYRKALEASWSALKIVRENELDSEAIELAIQRISRAWRRRG